MDHFDAQSRLPLDFLSGMLAASPDCVKLLSGDGVVHFMNDRGVQLNELTSESEVVGKRFADLWPEDERAKIEGAIAGAAEGRVSSVEGFCPTAKGTARWWELRFAPFAPSGSHDLMIVGISRDVTERVLAQRAAREEASHGRTWMVNPDMLSVVGVDGVFESVNPAWTATLGWAQSELVGSPFEGFAHPDDVQDSREAFATAVDRGEAVLRFENRYRAKGGGHCWLSWLAVPEGGKVFCSARDVTADKERDAQLALRSRERDRAWRLSQDLLAVAWPDGALAAVNPAWSVNLGWSELELVGTNFAELTHPDDLAKTLMVFGTFSAAPLAEPYESRLRHKDGSHRWFAWTAALEDGAVFATGRPTTEAHERADALSSAEDALRQAQKMEAVGQLTGGLAHDFNNLLTGITGGMELARRRVMDGRLAEADRYLDAGLGAAKRAAALTHRLLAFSRRQTLAPEALAVNKLVAGMADLVRRTVGPQIEVEVVAGVGLWPVLADASQLESALLNLCINARDAMPDGGKITIETANRSIDDRTARGRDLTPGQYVSMCVSDNGVGMSADVVARAFDPFFTTKPIGLGTGLGLSMIYGFARQSGGHARIYSEVGKGSMVCVYLPRHLGEGKAEPARAEGGEPPARAEHGETVLVVDDEATVRMFISAVMGDLGYATLEAADGAEALKVLQSGARIDLLLTDVGLPGGMNGRQVADAGRQVRPGLRVLFVTGYAENAVLSHGHLDPGMHVLTKPFEIDTLARRVKEIIEAS